MGFLDIYIMLAGAPWGLPYMTSGEKGGGGPEMQQILRTNTVSILWTNMEGWVQNYVDVIYGSPFEHMSFCRRRLDGRTNEKRNNERQGMRQVGPRCVGVASLT